MRAPGPLLASGRDSDIFEYGPHHVLRRSRSEGRSQLLESRTMEYLLAQGYPVPVVLEIDATGRDLVMERVDGVTMVEAVKRAPWSLGRRARELAELHQRLHLIEPPEFLGAAPVGHGSVLVHMDLHPLNVLVGNDGPVVIDWTGAARGAADVDVAIAWELMSVGQLPVGRLEALLVGAARGALVRSFLACFDREALVERVRAVVAWKVEDPHMSSTEVAAMWALVSREETARPRRGAGAGAP
jgi:aminoglycoside phosphotransferase (APT) family kinase protein